ncbi:MAG TPA: protein translocase subunit SecD [Actinomycetota bacterium]|nr:protein translocase subunit SecD [Actinomycetota bacterium]
MRTKRYRIHLIAALVVALGGFGAIVATRTTPRLGLDLEGGISVTLTATGEVNSQVLQKTVEIIRERIDSLGVAEPEVTAAGTDNILIQLPGIKDDQRALEVIGTTAQLTFRQVLEQVPPTAPDKQRPKVTKQAGTEVNDQEVVYPDAEGGSNALLYRLAPATLTGDVITKAQGVVDPTSGQWSVSLDMNSEGADRWASFTSRLACLRDKGEQVKSQVAIVLDGKVESAAGMQDPASAGGSGGVACGDGITGGETQIDSSGEQDAKDLALVLKTGALPITLEQSEVVKVSPTLGRDSLTAGLQAGILGLALVVVYMLLYYRGLGVVVWLGLILFSATIYTVMALLGEYAGLSLSLAGVAGIIVSIGITADSYIVAFERLKDEIHSGKSMRAAVERGMKRAFRTILVADAVTASAAVILFLLAVGSVRGFALTLGLATVLDVLIAYFFTRPAVHVLAASSLSRNRLLGLRGALGTST